MENHSGLQHSLQFTCQQLQETLKIQSLNKLTGTTQGMPGSVFPIKVLSVLLNQMPHEHTHIRNKLVELRTPEILPVRTAELPQIEMGYLVAWANCLLLNGSDQVLFSLVGSTDPYQILDQIHTDLQAEILSVMSLWNCCFRLLDFLAHSGGFTLQGFDARKLFKIVSRGLVNPTSIPSPAILLYSSLLYAQAASHSEWHPLLQEFRGWSIFFQIPLNSFLPNQTQIRQNVATFVHHFSTGETLSQENIRTLLQSGVFSFITTLLDGSETNARQAFHLLDIIAKSFSLPFPSDFDGCVRRLYDYAVSLLPWVEEFKREQGPPIVTINQLDVQTQYKRSREFRSDDDHHQSPYKKVKREGGLYKSQDALQKPAIWRNNSYSSQEMLLDELPGPSEPEEQELIIETETQSEPTPNMTLTFSPPPQELIFSNPSVLSDDVYIKIGNICNLLGRFAQLYPKNAAQNLVFKNISIQRFIPLLKLTGNNEHLINAQVEILIFLSWLSEASTELRTFIIAECHVFSGIQFILEQNPPLTLLKHTFKLLNELVVYHGSKGDREVSILKLGLIMPIVKLLTHEDLSIAKAACIYLGNISTNTLDYNKDSRAKVTTECFPVVLRLLRSTQNDEYLACVLWLLHKISWSRDTQNLLSDNGAFDFIIEIITTSNNSSLIEIAALVFGNLSIIGNPRNFVSLTSPGGGIEAIIKLIDHPERKLKALALRCFSALSSQTTPRSKEHQAFFCSRGGIAVLLKTLEETTDEMIFECALFGLCNISPSNYTDAQKKRALQICLSVINKSPKDEKIVEAICWYLHKMAVTPENQILIGSNGGFKCIVDLLNHHNERIKSGACWVFSKLGVKRENWDIERGSIIKRGMEKVIEFLNHLNSKIQILGCRILGTLCINTTEYCERNQAFIGQKGGVPHLLRLLHDRSDLLTETACWCLASLSLLKENQELIIKENAVPILLEKIKSTNEKIAEGAAFCLANSITKDTQNVIGSEGLKNFIGLLDHENDRIFERACLGISKFGSNENIKQISEFGCFKIIVKKLNPKAPKVEQTPVETSKMQIETTQEAYSIDSVPLDSKEVMQVEPAIIKRPVEEPRIKPKENILEHSFGCIASLVPFNLDNVLGSEPDLIKSATVNLCSYPENTKIVNRICFTLNTLAIVTNGPHFLHDESIRSFVKALETFQATPQLSRISALLLSLSHKIDDFLLELCCIPGFCKLLNNLTRDQNCKNILDLIIKDQSILIRVEQRAQIDRQLSPQMWTSLALLCPAHQAEVIAKKIFESLKSAFGTQRFDRELFQEYLVAFSTIYDCKPSSEVVYPVTERLVDVDVDRYHRLYERNCFRDLQIVVGPRTFSCHRAVLCAGSRYFESLLTIGMKETNQSTITILEIEADDFDKLLRFLYLKEVEFDSYGEAFDFLNYGNLYQIADLQKLCVNFLVSHISMESVLQIFEWCESYLSEHLHPIREQAALWVCQNYNKIIQADSKALQSVNWDLLYKTLPEEIK